VLTVGVASAQQARISLPHSEITLSDLFGEIERQSGSTVIFDAGNVPPEQTVTLASARGTAAELLAQALPSERYAWQPMGNYIVVRTLPEPPSPAAQAPRPTQEDFERDIREYTQRRLQRPQSVVRYDTLRTVKPHEGVFRYPSHTMNPRTTGRTGRTSFERGIPPLLAAKSNLLWWAAGGTLNAAGEIGLGKKTSFEFSGGINRRNLKGDMQDNKKLTHWLVKPEFRYWPCERFNGHVFALHGFYGQYNVGGWDIPLLFEKEYRYEGDAYGAGIEYGYHLPLAKRWGLEFTAGAGVAVLNYTQYDCEKCGNEVKRTSKTYFGPTELGVKLVFMIK
jgi:hypothetical protein